MEGLDIYSTFTLDCCWICNSLPTVCQWFVNGLEINMKNITFFEVNDFFSIVVAEYLLFD